MEITPFGTVFAAVAVTLAIFRPGFLFPLTIVSASLHAPAVALVATSPTSDAIGVAPWTLASVLCAARLALEIYRRPERLAMLASSPTRSSILLSAYFVVAVISAFLLPQAFQGTEVFALSDRRGFDAPTVPLSWSLMNLVQAVNACLIFVVGLYAVICSQNPRFRFTVASALVVATAISLLLSLAQRAQWHGWVPEFTWMSLSLNPSYVHDIGAGGIIHRMAWPFSEASYASVWFAALCAGGVALLSFSARPWCGALCTLLAGAALANTLGMSGVAAFVVFLTIAVPLAVWRCVFRYGADAHARRRVAAAAVLILVIAAAWTTRTRFEALRYITPTLVYQQMVVPRLEGSETSGRTRQASNRHAAELVLSTWGLGVGLGSNRASSYLVAAASNVGVPGLLLLLLSTGGILVNLMKQANKGDSLAWFVVAGCTTSLIGVSLGIPDLNWPAWWIWPIIGLSLTFHRRQPVAGRHMPV